MSALDVVDVTQFGISLGSSCRGDELRQSQEQANSTALLFTHADISCIPAQEESNATGIYATVWWIFFCQAPTLSGCADFTL